MEEPLLFIQTPPFYYIEVMEKDEEQSFLEESTSVYELARTERIKNPVIARQLNYFSQPINARRLLIFHLNNGEKYIGIIEQLQGIHLKIKNNEQTQILNANDIQAITLSNRTV